MILPAIAYVMFAKQRPIFVKVFGVGIIGAALLEIMSTGSRGGFVALLITIAYIVLTGSSRLRLSLLVGIPLLGMLALPFVPHQSVQRIESLFDSNEASQSSAESSGARRALLMASLEATAQHPLLGVGPGTFEEYQADLAAQQHQKGMWHETHNGYTQISSECGIPALLFYLAAVFIIFKSLNRAAKLDMPIIPSAAKTFACMAVGYSASIIFLANAFRSDMLVIAAFTIAINQMIARRERAAE
jgi:O-antigen ligase